MAYGSWNSKIPKNITLASNLLQRSLKWPLHEVFSLLLVFLLSTFPLPRDEVPWLCAAFIPLIQHPVARINSIKFIKQLGLGEQFQKNLSESPLSFLNKSIPAGFMLLVQRLPHTWRIPAWEVRGRKGFGRVSVKGKLRAVCKSWA